MRRHILALCALLLLAPSYVLAMESYEGCMDCPMPGDTNTKMDVRCPGPIRTKADFRACLSRFSWSGVTPQTSLEDFRSASEPENEESPLFLPPNGQPAPREPVNENFLYRYHQWIVEKDGTLHLIGELG